MPKSTRFCLATAMIISTAIIAVATIGKPSIAQNANTAAEMVGPRGQTARQVIQKSDTNGDGRLSNEEFRGAAHLFPVIDTDGDGFVTWSELEARWSDRVNNPNNGTSARNVSDDIAYDGPIVDAHMHWFDGLNINDILAQAAENNVTRFVVFPRLFGSDGTTEQEADQLARDHGDIFWVLIGLQKPALTGKDRRGAKAWDWQSPPPEWKSFLAWAREELLSDRRRGLGELTARHYAYKNSGNDGERDLPIDSTIFNDLLRLSAETQRPIVLHAEAEHHVLESLEKQLTKVPSAIVVWAHACGRTSPGEARRLLTQFPNLHCDLANMGDQGLYGSLWPRAGTWTYQFEKAGQIIPEWRSVVIDFSDRFLLGMDINELSPWNKHQWNRRLERFRKLLGQLPKDVAAKLADKNATRLFGPRLQ